MSKYFYKDGQELYMCDHGFIALPGTGLPNDCPECHPKDGAKKIDETNPKDKLGALKPDLALVPSSAVVNEAVVFGLGAIKYGPYNWRSKKIRNMVYIAAALRHIHSYLDGEENDPESGRSHTTHARACLAIIEDAEATGNLIDDRPVKGAAAKLIKELTKQREPQPTEK